VVTDGFTGNVALKTMEGFASFLLGNLRDVFGTTFGRIAYVLVRKRLGAVRERLDPSEYGGAPLLGSVESRIIAHGSSNPRAIRNAIRAAANEALVERVTPRSSRYSRAMSPRCRSSPRARVFVRCWTGCASGCIAIPAKAARTRSIRTCPRTAAASAKVVEPEILPPEAVVSANGVALAAPHADGAHDEPHKTVEEAQAEAPPQSVPGPHKPEPS